MLKIILGKGTLSLETCWALSAVVRFLTPSQVLGQGVSFPSSVATIAFLPCLTGKPWIHVPGTQREAGWKLQFLRSCLLAREKL